jgi:hypothetical protein
MSRKNQMGSKLARILSQSGPTFARVSWPQGLEESQGSDCRPLNDASAAAHYLTFCLEDAAVEARRQAERAECRRQAEYRKSLREAGLPVSRAAVAISQYGSSAHTQRFGIRTMQRRIRRYVAH